MPDFHRIDMEHFARKEHFDYFRSLAYPYLGVTVNVDITDFLGETKKMGRPFFLSFLWHAAKSANAIPEFRQRIDGDGIIEFSKCMTSHTVAKADGTYSYCSLDPEKSFEDFLPYAEARQNQAAEGGDLADNPEELPSYFFISTLPWFSYTSFIQPVPLPADSNPRITWGRYFKNDGRIVMPVSVLVHHALADGRHLGDFYQNLEESLRGE